MKFTFKIIIFFTLLALLPLLPYGIGYLIQIGLLIVVGAILVLAVWAVHRDLNLLNAFATPGEYRHVTYNGLTVYYTPELNGGGLGLSHEYVRLVSKTTGTVGHVYEYCCGPGFIGFNLLAHNLCEKLTLSDINPRAINAVRETIRKNGLEDRVTVYLSDCLQSIPETERWDLIVSNPPWDLRPGKGGNLILDDSAARVHTSLFQALSQEGSQFLAPGGSILLVESHEYTSKKEMVALLEGTNLAVSDYYRPTPPWRILHELTEYPHISKPMAITLRLGLCCLEIYFICMKRRTEFTPSKQVSPHPTD